MSFKESLFWICTLAVLSGAGAGNETLQNGAGNETLQNGAGNETLQNSIAFKNETCKIIAAVGAAAECGDAQTWNAQGVASLLLSVRNLSDALHQHQLQDCGGSKPSECPEAEVPKNGGLACVTVAKRRYCKPFCNHGYDFGFLRLSRLYDECSERTGYKWSSQYIGGNKLAVCNEERVQVAGARSMYFPQDQDCLATKSSSELQSRIIKVFTSELKKRGVQGKPRHACLVCG